MEEPRLDQKVVGEVVQVDFLLLNLVVVVPWLRLKVKKLSWSCSSSWLNPGESDDASVDLKVDDNDSRSLVENVESNAPSCPYCVDEWMFAMFVLE